MVELGHAAKAMVLVEPRQLAATKIPSQPMEAGGWLAVGKRVVKGFGEESVELNPNFLELERPKERFPLSYLPKHTEMLFREALSCYSTNNFNAFASMCRRAAVSSFEAMGHNGKLRAFDEVMMAQDIAGIDDETFAPIKQILFESQQEEDLPLLSRSQAGVLLEVMKDMFYQCFVRRGKLTRAIKVRQFFVRESNGGLRPSA